jgi:acetyl esterase/lipase
MIPWWGGVGGLVRHLGILSLLLWGCSEKVDPDDPDDQELQPAPLAELSDGDCPDMSASGISSFQSGGLERAVSVIIPEDRPADAPVIFTFHGLVPSDYDPLPELVAGFQLQQMADELGAIVITPVARVTNLPGVGSLLLWGVLDDADPDLVLFDDLRTCVAHELGADLSRISAWGHSGGALWTTVLMGERSIYPLDRAGVLWRCRSHHPAHGRSLCAIRDAGVGYLGLPGEWWQWRCMARPGLCAG